MASPPVLVVDDHPDVADSTARLLAAHGHVTRTAYSCTDALWATRDFRPEVVVLDLGLPDGDGCELAARLTRVLGYRPRFVALTGLPDQEERTARAGIDYHLEKPVDPVALLAVVDSSGESPR